MSCLVTLKGNGLKLTPQRKLIIEAIHGADEHLTAEEIITYVQARMPKVNKSTIYRTLQLLEETGCVYKSELGEQSVYHHAEEGHHHHLVCSQCGKTIDCDEDLLAPLEQLLAEKHGFQINFRHMVMTGLCEDCRREGN
jgi:Fur family ferric uptake transcriptional regulator